MSELLYYGVLWDASDVLSLYLSVFLTSVFHGDFSLVFSVLVPVGFSAVFYMSLILLR